MKVIGLDFRKKLRPIILFAIAGLMFNPLIAMDNRAAALINMDFDNAGHHIVRDDDNSKEGNTYTIDSAEEAVHKRLWTYYNEMDDADAIYLWVYAKLLDPVVHANPTHKLMINKQLLMQFNAGDYFVPHQFRWTYFNIPKSSLMANGCNDIMIQNNPGFVPIEFGVDRSFELLSNPGQFYNDFDRSYTEEHTPLEFQGEFMIYLEFVNVDEEESKGFYMNPSIDFVELRKQYNPPPLPNQWSDFAGIIIDWSTMDINYWRNIYLAYLWIYCKPSGNYNAGGQQIEIMVNGQTVRQFNPYEELPWNKFSWLRTEVHNLWGPKQLSKNRHEITIKAMDIFPNDNNIQIAKHDGADIDLTWWSYVDDQSQHQGSFLKPDECEGELMIYLQVYLSDPNKDTATKVFRYGSSSVECKQQDPLFDHQHADAALADFNGVIDYADNFIVKDEWVRQCTIYGERRGFYDDEYGDLTDIYFHYGLGDPNRPNNPGTIVLFDNLALNVNVGVYVIGQTTQHNNDDPYDFTQQGTRLTEAESNDWFPAEDDGSDGFNYDLEYIFFFSPGVFSDQQANRYQTLLWHGGHAVFGFDEISIVKLNEIIEEMKDYLFSPDKSVRGAFDDICDIKGVTGYYFYNMDCDGEDIWGKELGTQVQDSLDRSKIQYHTT